MNLSSIDLNLLVVFEALYETRNVTLAARRINRAQPSVSNALSRLRTAFHDELFVRTASAMIPTDRAESLMPMISQALEQIRYALNDKIPFDPRFANARRFVIAASDYADVVVVPEIVSLVRRDAPHAQLRICALNRNSIYEDLDEGRVDIAIGGHLTPPKRMGVSHLYKEDFVCIADRRHPALLKHQLNIETYVQLPHALFVPSDDGSTRGVIDAALDHLGMRRNIVATFAHLIAVPHSIHGTDLICTVAKRATHKFLTGGLKLHPLPVQLGNVSFSVDMVYGRRAENNAALRWLRNTVTAAIERMHENIPNLDAIDRYR
jgi:DNA-binding transcriptional LysR family regulator